MGVREALSLKCEDSGEVWTVSDFEFTNNNNRDFKLLGFGRSWLIRHRGQLFTTAYQHWDVRNTGDLDKW